MVTWLAPMVNLRPWAVAGYEFSPSKLCKPAQEFETLTQALQSMMPVKAQELQHVRIL